MITTEEAGGIQTNVADCIESHLQTKIKVEVVERWLPFWRLLMHMPACKP